MSLIVWSSAVFEDEIIRFPFFSFKFYILRSKAIQLEHLYNLPQLKSIKFSQ